MNDQELADLRSLDIHAHFVDAQSLAAMSEAAPAFAPQLVEDEQGLGMQLPPGMNQRFPQGTVRRMPRGLLDVEVRKREMKEQNGVSMQTLSSYSWLNFYHLPGELAAELHRIHNDGMIRTAKEDPARFLAMPGLPMQDTARSVAEIERIAKEPVVCAVGLGTNVNGRNLDDPAFEDIWAALDHFDLPVLLHPPGKVAGEDRIQDYHLINLIGNPVDSTIAAGTLVCSGVLERYGNLRFCFVHGGGFAPYQAGRWDHGFRVREETSSRIPKPPTAYFDRLYWDSLTHDPQALAFLGQRFGWSQVMLGTDYPWDMSTTTPVNDLVAAGLAGDELRKVASTNAREFLRWPAS